MNGARQHIEKIWSLPYQVTLRFSGPDGAPDRKFLNPVLRYEGQEKVLARPKVINYSRKQITLLLGEELACHGLGRYEVCIHQHGCEECDCVKLEFKGDCAITHVQGQAVEDKSDVRY